MDNQRIIFVGSQNLGGLLDDGETMKNYMLAKGLETCGCRVCRIDMRNRPKRMYYMAKYVLNLLFCRSSKIVMSSSPFVADKLFKLAKILGWKGKNEYYWVIGGTFGKLITEKRVNKKLYIDINKIVVEGKSMKVQLDAAGFKNALVLPNMKEIQYVPKKEHNENKVKRFVFLSRVMPEKGVDYIIEASRSLVDKGVKNFKVDLYGSVAPQYKESLQNQLATLPNVNYKGFLMLNENKGYDTLATYDVMLFPTYWHGEGFPGILIDAFIAGLPVIASDWNLNSSLINDGDNGIIIPPHDPVALAETMQRVIEGKVDITKMSESAQNGCYNFDLKNVINKQLLEEISIL